MTKEEARAILNIDAFEDLEDAHDHKLFEFKQYLLTKVPFVKTYESKFVQMDRVQNALDILGFEISNDNVVHQIKNESNPVDLLSCLKAHQSMLSKLKLKVGNATNIETLKDLMQELLLAYRSYAVNWTSFTGEIDGVEEVKASVEFDPVISYRP